MMAYLRHGAVVRVTHWINVLALVVLLMSGLQIFNAHPALYWGQSSYSGRPPLFVLEHGFPGWITIPGTQWLAMGRRWHLFFAWLLVLNGLVYLAHSFASRHVARDLVPTLPDWRGIGRSIVDHLRLRHPHGAEAARYNVLQKLAYLAVIFVLLPLMALTGWAMSPGLDSAVPHWVEIFGGRQSARTLHFICAWLLVAFAAVHVFEVIVSGLWNNLRSMITGRYRIPGEAGDDRT
jgi:thiosulfate reductase cytochrome b subunit